MAVTSSYLKYVALTGASDEAWQAVCVNGIVYGMPYNGASASPNLNRYSLAAIDAATTGASLSLLDGTRLSLAQVPGIGSNLYNNDNLGCNATHTKLFVHKAGSTNIYEVNPSTGEATLAFVGASTMPQYCQFVVDETNKLIFSAAYSSSNLHCFSYTGSTYAITLTAVGNCSMGGAGGIGVDIYKGYIFVGCYGSNDVRVSSRIASNLISTDFSQVATKVSQMTSSCGMWVRGDKLYWGGYGPNMAVFTLSGLPQKKVLVIVGSTVKTYSGGAWSDVGSTPVTEAMFTSSGIVASSVSSIPYSAWATLGDSPTLEIYSAEDAASNVTSTKIPSPQTILPTGNLSLAGVETIDSITLTSTVSGSGVLRMLASIDDGTTWQAWSGTEWVTVAIGDIGTSGMTPTEFSAVTGANWGTLALAARKIRFAYYLYQQSSTDVARTDAIATQLDMLGTWKEAISATDYSIEWSNTTLVVKVFTSGSYKINY